MMIFKDVDVKVLFELMQEYDIAETTIKNGKLEVTVKRNKEPVVLNAAGVLEQSAARISFPNADAVELEAKSTDGGGISGEKEREADRTASTGTGESPDEMYSTIKAPLVGTFYRASAPDADPFVEIGDIIDVGDVVCIVEAMKSMNEIQSDVKGVVKEICLENAQMVEFDQVIFKVDTAT
jgi:acetyl-CoA carboxylase biotin carboxyl carrier protein